MRIKNSALVDTNILLLLMFASLNRNPSNDTRLSRYNSDDIFTIKNLIMSFNSLITTPNILTEVSNQTKGYEEYQWLSSYIETTEEKSFISKNICKNEYFYQIGLTDTVLLSEDLELYNIITDDKNLYLYLQSLNRHPIYYQEYKESIL